MINLIQIDEWLDAASTSHRLKEYEKTEYFYLLIMSQYPEIKNFLSGTCKLLNKKIRQQQNQKKEIKISIIIPVYNNEEYLKECLDSAICQSVEEIEIIIVNDGSTNPYALEIMNSYALEDKRIKLINKNNSGYGHSMNTGIENAAGKYIAILESDDFYTVNGLKNLYTFAEIYNLDFIKSDYCQFYGEKGNRKYKYFNVAEDENYYYKVLNPNKNIEILNTKNVIWNGIYKKSYLTNNKIKFNETPGASFQDNGFWFQSYFYAKRIMYIHEKLYMLRRDNADSSRFSKDKVYCMCDEYAFIYKKMIADRDVYKKFSAFYQYKKYNNYIFTLQRVHKKFRQELLKRYKREFNKAYQRGELKRKLFGPVWKSLNDVISGTYSCSWMNNAEVSVIIPVYNAERYIGKALDSLLAQTFKNFEIICIDDGSTDNSLAIILDYADADKRIKAFRQKNGGAGKARNVGMQHAIGDYLIFLDADDTFHPQLIEKQLARVKRDNADFCVCAAESLDEFSNATKKLKYALRLECLPQTTPFKPEEIRGNIFKAFVGWAWDKIYSRKFIDQHNLKFQELTSTNDMLFVFSALIKAKKITFLPDTLISHRVNVPASVSNTREKNPLNFSKALEALKSSIEASTPMDRLINDFQNYAIHAWLWNFQTLRGVSAVTLYNMKDDFINKFELYKLSLTNIYNFDEYQKFISI